MHCGNLWISSSRRLLVALCLHVLFVFSVSPLSFAAGELGFTKTVAPGLIASMVDRFGAVATKRISTWVAFASEQQIVATKTPRLAPEAGQLQAVNAYVNTVPWIEDMKHWGQIDYWATPAETIASHGGDCEDFAITKYFLLKELGVSIERLRITYVRAVKINQPHMVLAYYANPGAEPLILDNLDPRVRPASERTDLVPVYSFNDEDVIIVQGNRKADSSQIRAWQGVIERLRQEAKL